REPQGGRRARRARGARAQAGLSPGGPRAGGARGARLRALLSPTEGRPGAAVQHPPRDRLLPRAPALEAERADPQDAGDPVTEIWKEFTFESAHRLPNVPPTHKCARLHGHSYRVRLTARGELDPQLGWIVDFDAIREAFE